VKIGEGRKECCDWRKGQKRGGKDLDPYKEWDWEGGRAWTWNDDDLMMEGNARIILLSLSYLLLANQTFFTPSIR
jgi:hypothetical protein